MPHEFFHPRIALILLSWFVVLDFGQAAERGTWIIAHRGGVVDATHSENSLSGLEAAIRRGYTHVEVDARATLDGDVVCFHNDSLLAEAGVNRRISETRLAELKKVRLTRSREPIPTIDQYLSRCQGRVDVMIDLKGCPEPVMPRYAGQILAALERHRLLDGALILVNKRPVNNQDRLIPYFLGKAKVSFRGTLAEAQRQVALKSAFPQHYYVFNHGADFSRSDVTGFQRLGLHVVVSINTQHYAADSAQNEGENHVRGMIEWGVDGLQIDSVYDRLAFQALSAEP